MPETSRRSVVAVIPHPRDPSRFASILSMKHGRRPELPGGKVEQEGLRDALRREVREEVGIEIENIKKILEITVIGAGSERRSVFVYSATTQQESLRSSEEGEAAWLTQKDLERSVYQHLLPQIWTAYARS